MITLKLTNAEARALREAATLGVEDISGGIEDDFGGERARLRLHRTAEEAASKLSAAVRAIPKRTNGKRMRRGVELDPIPDR